MIDQAEHDRCEVLRQMQRRMFPGDGRLLRTEVYDGRVNRPPVATAPIIEILRAKGAKVA